MVTFQELDQVKPENTVYKMIGPVLVPQEQGEAKANVDKRLEFIKSDMFVPISLSFCNATWVVADTSPPISTARQEADREAVEGLGGEVRQEESGGASCGVVWAFII